MPLDRVVRSGYTYAAWILSGVSLVLVLPLRLLPAMLAGMLVYELVHVLAPTVNDRLSDKRAKVGLGAASRRSTAQRSVRRKPARLRAPIG